MINGLVGHTGFVGSNLLRQRRYDRTFHRANIAELSGHFARLVISAVPARKWQANADPEADAATVDELIRHLGNASADRAILISTVDVYPDPRGVDERTVVEPDDHTQAYGRNRLRLERFVQGHYAAALVMRLPALFGPGLRKNLIYDLMLDRQEEFCHRDSTFQFYDLERLSSDIDIAVDAGLSVLNLATEPMAAHRVGLEVFDRTLTCTSVPRVDYDMHTLHAHRFDAPGPYLLTEEQILSRLRTFSKQPVAK